MGAVNMRDLELLVKVHQSDELCWTPVFSGSVAAMRRLERRGFIMTKPPQGRSFPWHKAKITDEGRRKLRFVIRELERVL